MNFRFDNFCYNVCRQVKHATRAEKEDIKRELTDHLQDHADALIAIGRDEQEANAAAVAAMGDPVEIGKALNREYPLITLLLSRIAALLVIVLLLQLFLVPYGLQSACVNLATRWVHPVARYGAQDAAQTPVDYRFDLPGNDVLYIYAMDLRQQEYHTPSGETYDYTVVISLCVYDRNPFGLASGRGLVRMVFSDTLDETRAWSERSFNSIKYATVCLPAAQDETGVRVDYSGFGYELHGMLPLDWEETR